MPRLFVTPYGDPVESVMVSQDINGRQSADDHIVVPMMSTKLGEVNNLFCEIVNVAGHLPGISISKSEAARGSCKQYNKGLAISRRSFMLGLTVASSIVSGAYLLLRQRRLFSF